MNPYRILGVEIDAIAKTIKKAYQKLAMRWHPDRADGDEAMFKEIQEAYNILKDDDKRAYFDRTGEAQKPQMPLAEQMLMDIFNAMITSKQRGNLISICRDMTVANIDRLNQMKAGVESEKRILLSMVNRVSSKGKDNLFKQLVESKIKLIDRQLESMVLEDEKIKGVLKLLIAYTDTAPDSDEVVQRAKQTTHNIMFTQSGSGSGTSA